MSDTHDADYWKAQYEGAEARLSEWAQIMTDQETKIEGLESHSAALGRERGELADAAEMLWVVLANVSGGDWTKQTEEWQKAARRWADNYHLIIKKLGFPSSPAEKVIVDTKLSTIADDVWKASLPDDK